MCIGSVGAFGLIGVIVGSQGDTDSHTVIELPGHDLRFFSVGLFWLTIILVAAIALIITSRKLKTHRSRTLCLVIAGIECLICPVGTVLGIFTIMVLMKESVIHLFAGQPLPETQYQSGQPDFW